MTTVFTTNELPKRAMCFHDESIVLVGNALLQVISTSQQFNCYFYQSTSADGDSFSQGVFLQAGVYTITFLGATGPNSGKIDWYVDGNLAIAAQDWYTVGLTYNVAKVASVTIVNDGWHTIRGVVNGSTPGGANNYRIYLTAFWFKQASD